MNVEERIKIEQELASYAGPDQVVSSLELAEKYKQVAAPAKRFETGIPKLDQATDGFEPGELIVVAGPTGNGKTFLADTITKNLRTQKVFTVFFTYEVSPKKFVQWHSDVENVVFLPEEHKSQNLEWLKTRCWEAKLKYGVEVVVIDHLHYLIPMQYEGSASLEIGAVMRFLKQEIALGLNMAVILLCHITKIRPDEEPSIHHLRDSSLVGQESDIVLMIWRRFDIDEMGNVSDTMNKGLATVKVDKARRSGCMRQKIKIKRDGQKLVESNDEPEPAITTNRRTSVDSTFRSGNQKGWMD